VLDPLCRRADRDDAGRRTLIAAAIAPVDERGTALITEKWRMVSKSSSWRSQASSLVALALFVLGSSGQFGPSSMLSLMATADAAQSAATAAPPATAVAPAAAAAAPAQPLAATDATWSPEALEDLLAPVALYPDPVLAQLLVAVTNPQEILDAGNWLVANPELEGKALDAAAEKVGFTLPTRSLVQFPDVIDKLCLNLPWTEELGQAYVNDQAGVMEAVQRLRVQAQEAGNLKSSKEMTVATTQQQGKSVVTLEPARPNVVHVPQYDPVAAYAPAGTTITTAPGATTNVTVNPAAAPATPAASGQAGPESEKKYDAGSLILTGLLSFGAGMLVNEVFDDDDDDYWGRGFYGGMYYLPMPYYPPYVYRPVYGGGFYPGFGYNRPPIYIRGGTTIVINQNNNYYRRYRDDASILSNRRQPRSPITAAKPNRPELRSLNARAARGPERKAPSAAEAWKGRGGYAGADPKVRAATGRQPLRPGASGSRPAPKVQGSYAGRKPTRERPAVAGGAGQPGTSARPAARPLPTPGGATARPAVASRPASGTSPARPSMRPATPDRGRFDPSRVSDRASRPAMPSMQRPSVTPTSRPQRPALTRTGVSRGGGGRADAAAGARGRASMPPGGAARARAAAQQRGR
jgi:hypothetical protein